MDLLLTYMVAMPSHDLLRDRQNREKQPGLEIITSFVSIQKNAALKQRVDKGAHTATDFGAFRMLDIFCVALLLCDACCVPFLSDSSF